MRSLREVISNEIMSFLAKGEKKPLRKNVQLKQLLAKRVLDIKPVMEELAEKMERATNTIQKGKLPWNATLTNFASPDADRRYNPVSTILAHMLETKKEKDVYEYPRGATAVQQLIQQTTTKQIQLMRYSEKNLVDDIETSNVRDLIANDNIEEAKNAIMEFNKRKFGPKVCHQIFNLLARSTNTPLLAEMADGILPDSSGASGSKKRGVSPDAQLPSMKCSKKNSSKKKNSPKDNQDETDGSSDEEGSEDEDGSDDDEDSSDEEGSEEDDEEDDDDDDDDGDDDDGDDDDGDDGDDDEDGSDESGKAPPSVKVQKKSVAAKPVAAKPVAAKAVSAKKRLPAKKRGRSPTPSPPGSEGEMSDPEDGEIEAGDGDEEAGDGEIEYDSDDSGAEN
jgi:hypothetical protein